MQTTSDSVIQTENLRKTYPGRGKGKKAPVEAVRGISFKVDRGEIFGLLGPNGAGKTTTMRMLCTLLAPTSGEADIAGQKLSGDQSQIRNKIGYVSQVGGMQREVTGRENLMLQARLYGMSHAEAKKRINELLDLLGISAFADRKTVTYSGGQRRIFDLAAGIIHRPQILFLDEPSTGLDPQNRAHVWEQVKKLNQSDTTIFLTTHYLDEADALCNRVAIVDNGTIVALASPDELKRQISGDSISLGFKDETTAEQALKALESSSFIKEKHVKDSALNLYVQNGEEDLPLIISTLHQKNILTRTIQLSRPSLDDVFLKLTGRSLRESEVSAQ